MKVGIIMGSKSDWPVMEFASLMLDEFGVENEARVLSAHRTPAALSAWIGSAEERGIRIIIAGAGGAAHLPGVIAAQTLLPVIGVPIQTEVMGGMDSLLSIVQMPSGVPVATMAIGKAGAQNAALFAISVLGLQEGALSRRLADWRAKRAEILLEHSNLEEI